MNGSRAPGRPLLDRAVVLDFRRRRIVEALAEVCAERGYRDVTVAHVVSRAATSRNAFYAIYSNKDEAFESLLDEVGGEFFGRIEAGCESGGEEPLSRIEGALGSVVEWVAERPHEARVCLVEAAVATPGTLGRQQEAIVRLAAMLREAAPVDASRPPIFEELLVGGVHYVLSQLVLEGEAARARELVPDLSALLLAPYLAGRRREE